MNRRIVIFTIASSITIYTTSKIINKKQQHIIHFNSDKYKTYNDKLNSDNYNNNSNNNNNYNQTLNKTLNRNFIADAADLVSPSVVNISYIIDGSIITTSGSGSGFIISKDGFIVTNAHVVDKPINKVIITMWNGKKRYGIIHSLDRQSDIALIKLINIDENEDLPIAKLGINNKPRLGEFVIALGSPLNLSNSITFGIISSTVRHASELGIIKILIIFIKLGITLHILYY